MLDLEQAIDVIHGTTLTQCDTLLVLLAIDPKTPKSPDSIRGLGKSAGVRGIAGWNVSTILGRSKGHARSDGTGWLLSSIGKSRVTTLAPSKDASEIEMQAARQAPASSNGQSAGSARAKGRVFIGHGGSPAWKDLRDLLRDKLHLEYDEFKRVSTPGMTTVERLEQMLHDSVFAFLVLTAEDEQRDGRVRARQNVIHEAGLFQGKYGFKRAIILLENGCEEFSNVKGLTHIPFLKGNILAASEEIRDVLAREGIVSASTDA